MAQFLVTTTGTQNPVVFTDLGARSISHPTTDLDLLLEFSLEELRLSSDVQAALTAGYITAKDENDQVITNIATQQVWVTQKTFDSHALDTSSNPHGVTPAQIGAEVTGSVSASIDAHLSASNPHPQYTNVSEFVDDEFRLLSAGDQTKQIQFLLSAISSGTTRTLTLPDKDITLNFIDNMDTAVTGSGHIYQVLAADGSGSVDFISLATSYDAVVAPDGSGDFTSIAAAFDAGHITVFAHVGTYVETSDINIPQNGELHCEEGTTISFNGQPYSIKVDAGADIEVSGTITATYGSPVLVGSGTTFTNASVGDNIIVDGIILLPVVAINSDTQLVVALTWLGPSASGMTYQLRPTRRFRLTGFLVTGSTTFGLWIRGGSSSFIYKVLSMGNAVNLKLEECASVQIDSCAFYSSTSGVNVDISSCSSIVFDTIASIAAAVCGFKIENSQTTGFSKIFAALNNCNGITVGDGCVGTVISDSNVRRNFLTGAAFLSGSDRTTIHSLLSFDNGGDGIYLAGSNTVCEGAVVTANSGSGIFCGPNSLLSNSKINENVGAGISIQGDSCVITSNEVRNNNGNGIEIPESGDSDYSIILGNRVASNGGTGIFVADGNIANKIGVNYVNGHVTNVDINDDSTIIIMENLIDDLTPQLGGNLDAQSKSIYDIKRASFDQEYDIGNVSGSMSVDWSNGNIQVATLVANVTSVTFSSSTPGRYSLRVVQGGSGGYALSGWSSTKWRQSQVPDISSGAAGDEYIFTFEYRGVSPGFYGDVDSWR